MDSYLTWQTGVLMAALLAGVGASIPDRRRLALVWAALLPIDYLHGVSVTLLDALRYSGAIVLTLAFAPTLAAEARPRLRQIGAILLGLATIRGLAAVVHHDPNGRQFAVVLTLATLVAWAMALRPRLHLHLVVGYMAGLTLSVAVSIMQALHLPTLVEGNNSGQRYPGLATYTMLFTWQVAVGMVILGVVITTRITHRHLWWWMSVALFPFFAMAMVTNGAQGGLLGLFTAFVAFLRFGPVRLGSQAGRRWIMATLALVTLMVTAAFLTQIEIPTITDWGDGGYHNERARFDIVFDGLNEFRAHPLLGVSRTDFIYQYRIAPHFLPVDSAAVSGVVGLALSVGLLGWLGWAVLRGPADRRAGTLGGYLVLVVLTTNTLTDSYGPFVGVSRALPLWIALVAAGGHWPPPRLDPEPEDSESVLHWWRNR